MEKAACQGLVKILINKYQECCQLFSLKQLITCLNGALLPNIAQYLTK